MDGMFKESYLEKKRKEEKEKENKWVVYFVIFYKKINMIMLWIAILLNASIIVFTIYNFNIGIMLFLLNQYFVILYYMKVRKEKEEK